jgi:type IV secretory pathway VirB10-like protein
VSSAFVVWLDRPGVGLTRHVVLAVDEYDACIAMRSYLPKGRIEQIWPAAEVEPGHPLERQWQAAEHDRRQRQAAEQAKAERVRQHLAILRELRDQGREMRRAERARQAAGLKAANKAAYRARRQKIEDEDARLEAERWSWVREMEPPALFATTLSPASAVVKLPPIVPFHKMFIVDVMAGVW